jgi:hypothetical protein
MINQQTHFFNMKSLAIKLAKTLNTLYSQWCQKYSIL